jgi:hypothetical protein
VEFPVTEILVLALLLGVVWGLPNSQQWLGRFQTGLGALARTPAPGSSGLFVWQPTVAFGMIVGCVGFFSLMRALSAAPTEFLYFKF